MKISKHNILDFLKTLNPELQKRGIVKLGLFGSYAKDKADVCSDIDITIECSCDFVEKSGGGFEAMIFIDELREKISKNFKVQVDICDTTTMTVKAKKETLDGVIYV